MKRARYNRLITIPSILFQYIIIHCILSSMQQQLSLNNNVKIGVGVGVVNGLDIFGIKKRKRLKLEAKHKQIEEERKENLLIINDIEIMNKKKFYMHSKNSIIFIMSSLLVLSLFGSCFSGISKKKYYGHRCNSSNKNEKDIIDVIVVGCGLPKKSMGWFHITQLLEMKNINIKAIIEPYYLDETKYSGEIPESLQNFLSSMENLGVEIASNINELSSSSSSSYFTNKTNKRNKSTRPTLCLISGRTIDNPIYFKQCIIKLGISYIYLEKPGAVTVNELQDMKSLANEYNVKVYMGYNKNVSPYIEKSISLYKQLVSNNNNNDNDNATKIKINKNNKQQYKIFFSTNNSYNINDLIEVFTRNNEGLLKNMVIHELALLVTYFNINVENIDKFIVNTNKLYSQKLKLLKSTSINNDTVYNNNNDNHHHNENDYIIDFSRVAFKITTKKQGLNISIMADRSGGNTDFVTIKDGKGHVIHKFDFPDDNDIKRITSSILNDTDMMPYFFVQCNDYLELKNRIIKLILEEEKGKDDVDVDAATSSSDSLSSPYGVATIDIGIEAMRLAEFATLQLDKALKAD